MGELGAVLARSTRRVAMADTDAAGIIYFASPLRWAGDMFTDWLVEVGHPLSALFSEGLGTPVVSSRADYSSPLALDEVVDLEMRTSHVGNSSFALKVLVTRPGDPGPAVEVTVYHVFGRLTRGLGATFVAQPMPGWLRGALASSHRAADPPGRPFGTEVSA